VYEHTVKHIRVIYDAGVGMIYEVAAAVMLSGMGWCRSRFGYGYDLVRGRVSEKVSRRGCF
jgi:hypothetical protein